jgi:hypothetical protein
VRDDDFPGYGEADPGTRLVLAGHAIEPVEDMRQRIGWDS